MKDYLKEIRRDFHMHPELSEQEERTAARIQEELSALGIESRIMGTHSVIADIQGKKSGEGKTIALRADIDALPVREANDVSYCSQNPGVMHACGHDSHATMLIGAAKLLKERENDFAGTVRLIFQEAEETLTGAKRIVAEGVLNGVDGIIGMHVMPFIPVGTYAAQPGAIMSAGGGLEIRVHGLGGHASAPERVINPIPILHTIMAQFNAMLQQHIAPDEFLVMTPTLLNAGVKTNVIPAEAYVYYNWRYYDIKFEEILMNKFGGAAKAIAEANGATAEVNYIPKTYPTVNDPAYCELVKNVAMNKFPGKMKEENAFFAGSEDFAYYQREVPGVFIMIGAMPEDGPREPHNEYFDIHEDVLELGANLYTECVLEALVK